MKKDRSLFPRVYLAVVLGVMYLPILLVVIYSFNAGRLSSVWEGFSLHWYQVLFKDAAIFEALRNSLVLAGLTCLAAAVIGTAGALLFPMDDITDFLYLIGSVFAPMIAVQIADSFILKQDHSDHTVHVPDLIIWAIGFLLYRLLMRADIPIGSTLPDMVITILLCVLADRITKSKSGKA